jgi:hypothetical protein
MLRRLFAIISVLSLLFLAAMLALWNRSYRIADIVGCYRNNWSGNTCRVTGFGVVSEMGGLRFFLLRRSGVVDPLDRAIYLRKDTTEFGSLHERPESNAWVSKNYRGADHLGFGVYFGARKEPILAYLPTGAGYGDPYSPPMSRVDLPREVRMTTNDVFLFVPHWFVAVISLLLPIRWLLRRKPPLPGFFQRCRYNLTGNTSGVCPECGTPVRPDLSIIQPPSSTP